MNMTDILKELGSVFAAFDIWQVLSSFIFLFAIVDPLGNIPVTLNMERRGVKISPWQVSLATIVILITFLFAGEWVLKLFGVKIEYFAIAGGFVIFLMALEMVLDVAIFKNEGLDGSGSIVPLAFPMYAGPGAFTAVLSITAEYDNINLVVAITLNTLVLFGILSATKWLTKYIGQTTLYILRKFFGIIVLAIACKLMFGNLAMVFS
jgi:multiple antibiotic resistance protein